MALVFFTYAGDAEFLELSVQAATRLRRQGHAVDVYVADDAAAPLAKVPSGCKRWMTRFKRRGNLNGAECICGMVDVYNAIFKNGFYEWVLKVDSDTFVNSLDWLHGVSAQDYALAGTVHRKDYCTGPCYAVSKNGAEWLRDRLHEPSWRGAAERGFCEDKVIYNMCKFSGLKLHVLKLEGEPHGKLWHDWEGVQLPFEELQRAYAVDFKFSRWDSKPENWAADAAAGLQRMREYVNFLREYETAE